MNNEEIREKILTEALAELKLKVGEVVTGIADQLYCDYLPHVESDTESNISNRVQGCLRNIAQGHIEASPDSSLVWVSDDYGYKHMISLSSYNLTLKPLCDLVGETIQTNRIKQLEDRIESLESQLQDSYRRL